VNAPRAAARQARDILRLTGLSFWRGFEGFYSSDDLTYAASIAYYALLSLFRSSCSRSRCSAGRPQTSTTATKS